MKKLGIGIVVVFIVSALAFFRSVHKRKHITVHQ